MSKKLTTKGLKISIWVLFLLYLVVLVNVIILKGGEILLIDRSVTEISLSQRILNINFSPFKTIIPYLQGEPTVKIALENLLGNIFAFSPLGFLLPLLFEKCNKIKNIFLISFWISFFIETIQVTFSLGSCDIDDLILNVLGSLLGFGIYYLFKDFAKRKLSLHQKL